VPDRRRRDANLLLVYVWAVTQAISEALALRRRMGPHLRAGRVVVCDRFTLDVAVALRSLYGHRLAPWALRFLGGLIRALAPTPARSYFLDVPVDMVAARHPGQLEVRKLSGRSTHYAEESQGAGARRVDGSRPRDQVCEELARDAWEALR
jgi:thymidylate kinase